MTSSNREAGEGVTSELPRILALSDGVFAIAMTLLVLTLAVPHLPPARVDTDLPKALLNTWPHTFSYIISFLVIGIYWRAHRELFRYIKRTDTGLEWINLVLLLTVAYLPFPTAVLGEYGNTRPAVIFYALSLALASFLNFLLWFYASFRHRLIASDVDDRAILRRSLDSLAPMTVFLVSIPISFISVAAAELSWALLSWVVGFSVARLVPMPKGAR